MHWRKRALSLAGALLIAVYFFRLVRPTLHIYFTPDDFMNLYRAWDFPVTDLVKANCLFFLRSDFYRPMGSAWYRSIFHFAGLNPFPFHLANMIFLAANVFLTYAVSRRLSGSREVGAVAALLGSYYHRLDCLYFDTGYIFDVLCYCFYFAAFLIYVRARQQKRPLNAREVIGCSIAYICALNSKEIAVTLPVFLLIYELLFHVKKGRLKAGFTASIWVTAAMSVIFLIGRMTGPGSLASYAGYHTVFTWERFMETSRHFLGDVFSNGGDWRAASVLALWGALLLIAVAARSRTLQFAWLFLMLSVLPIAFVFPRGAPQYYIPWFGYVLYASTLVVRSIEYATGKVWKDRAWLPVVRCAVVLAGLVTVLYPYFKRTGFSNVTSATVEAPHNREYVEQLLSLDPRVRPGSHLLFLNDPIRTDWENLIFIVRLAYRDRRLEIARAKRMARPPDEQQLARYDYVFDYRDGRFSEVKRP